MCEPAIHVLRSVFTRLVRQNAFASVATLRVSGFCFCFCFFCVSTNDWIEPFYVLFCRVLGSLIVT